LFVHWIRRAASRAACTAGSNSAIKTAMIAITTNSSIRVKPERLHRDRVRASFMSGVSLVGSVRDNIKGNKEEAAPNTWNNASP
jgi:hypothetical protein